MNKLLLLLLLTSVCFADDTAELQALLDQGGEIDLGTREWQVSGQGPGYALDVTVDETYLHSTGWGRVKLISAGGYNSVRVFRVTDVDNVRLEDFSIYGNVAVLGNTPAEQRAGIFARNTNGLIIESVNIYNTDGDAVNVGDSSDVRISHCYFNGNKRNGITLGGTLGLDGVDIWHNFFDVGIDTQMVDMEPRLGGGVYKDITIRWNDFKERPHAADRWAIVLGAFTGNPLVGAEVYNNTIEGSVLIRNGHEIDIHDNTILAGHKPKAMMIDRDSVDIQITDNIIESQVYIREVQGWFPSDIEISNNSIIGDIYAQDVNQLTIEDNTINSTLPYDVLAHGQSRNMVDFCMVDNGDAILKTLPQPFIVIAGCQ